MLLCQALCATWMLSCNFLCLDASCNSFIPLEFWNLKTWLFSLAEWSCIASIYPFLAPSTLIGCTCKLQVKKEWVAKIGSEWIPIPIKKIKNKKPRDALFVIFFWHHYVFYLLYFVFSLFPRHSLIIPKSHFCSLEATPPSVSNFKWV